MAAHSKGGRRSIIKIRFKMEKTNYRDVEVLGQGFNYPKAHNETIAFIATVIGLCAIVLGSLLILKWYSPDQMGKLPWNNKNESSHKIAENSDGSIIIKSENGFSFGFWTPSAKTKENIKKLPEKYWQIIGDENKSNEANNNFGERLMADSRITGYRRYEVYGSGSSKDSKNGFWWIVTVEGQYTDEFAKWFIGVYKDHWNIPEKSKIYFEVTSATPSHF